MNDTFYPTPSEAFKTDPPTAREFEEERVGRDGDVYDPLEEEER